MGRPKGSKNRATETVKAITENIETSSAEVAMSAQDIKPSSIVARGQEHLTPEPQDDSDAGLYFSDEELKELEGGNEASNDEGAETVTETTTDDSMEADGNEAATDDMPEIYKGKTVNDIIKMHANAEKKISEQGAELGAARRLMDTILQQGFQPGQPQPQSNELDGLDDDQILTNPKEALKKLQASLEKTATANLGPTIQRFISMSQLDAEFPAMTREAIIASPDFISWATSNYTQPQLAVANSDPASLHLMLRNYNRQKETVSKNQARMEAAKAESAKRGQAGKAAAGIPPSGGNVSGQGKIYRRAKLMEIMVKDPALYARMQTDVQRAYAEGRVR